jgi:transposase
MIDGMMTTKEVAARLGVHRKQVTHLTRQGRIHGTLVLAPAGPPYYLYDPAHIDVVAGVPRTVGRPRRRTA